MVLIQDKQKVVMAGEKELEVLHAEKIKQDAKAEVDAEDAAQPLLQKKAEIFNLIAKSGRNFFYLKDFILALRQEEVRNFFDLSEVIGEDENRNKAVACFHAMAAIPANNGEDDNVNQEAFMDANLDDIKSYVVRS